MGSIAEMADEIDPVAALDALLDAPNVQAVEVVAPPEKVAEKAEAAETQAEETAETQTEEAQTEETSTETQEAEPTDEITQERFRFKKDEDKAVAFLAKSRDISLLEAARLIQDQKAADPEPVRAEPAVDHVAAIDSEMAEIDKQIALLEESAEETLAPVDHKAIRALMEQKAELREARVYHITRGELAKEAKEQTAAEQAAAADQEQRDLAYAKYPDLLKAGTPLFEAVTKRVSQVKQSATPEGIFDLVAGVATRLGILPVEASKPNSGDKSGVQSPQQVSKTAKASTLIPVTAKATTTPPRHTISHLEPDANTQLREKMKAAKSFADIDEALGLGTAGARAGRLGAWT